MAIQLEFINVIIPIENIEKYSSISFHELLEAEKEYLGMTMWHDSKLVREGGMNVVDIEIIIKKWENRGLKLIKEVEGRKKFKDFCIVDSGRGLAIPCEWIEVNLKNGPCAWYRE